MKKKLLALVAVLTLVLTSVFGLTACGGEKNDGGKADWEYIKNKGTLIVGYTDYPPLDVKENGTVTSGFDYELAKMVGEKLGLKVEFKEIVDWDNKVMDINSKKIDCIWNGLTKSEELSKSINFSKPYLKNNQAIIVRKGETRFTDLNSLKNSKIGAEKGSAGASFIESNKLNADYKKVAKQLDLFFEMDSKNIDVAVMDSVLAAYYLALPDKANSYMRINGINTVGEEFAVGFRKGSDILTNKVNEAISELSKEQKIQQLAEKYLLENDLVK